MGGLCGVRHSCFPYSAYPVVGAFDHAPNVTPYRLLYHTLVTCTIQESCVNLCLYASHL